MNEDGTTVREEDAYSWGLGSSGQLGLGEEDDQSKPKLIQELTTDRRIIQLACGSRHSAAVTDSGVLLTWGSNEDGELGRSRRLMVPQRVDALESQFVVKVACGDKHTVCSTDNGSVFSWGANSHGQLGHGDSEPTGKPKLVKELRTSFVTSVACGAQHTLFLTRKGEVHACGDGSYGQLGKGELSTRKWPALVDRLNGAPVFSIVCGDQCSFALTVSGEVYGWGNNKFGQLGLGETEMRQIPTLVRTLRGKHIVQVSCGSAHVLARSTKDTLYAWGSGSFGQLGHGETQHEYSPRPVVQLSGIALGGIACGRRHSIAYRAQPHARALYTWGSGASGQLGHGDRQSHSIPTSIDFEPFKQRAVLSAACGGEHTVALLSSKPRSQGMVRTLADNVLSSQSQAALQTLIEAVELVFSAPGPLNASFLKATEQYEASPHISGVDLPAVREAYRKLLSLPSPYLEKVQVALNSSVHTLVTKLRHLNTDANENLRLFLIILEDPLLLTPSPPTLPILEKLAASILGLAPSARQALGTWWSHFSSEYFVRLIDIFQHFLTYLVQLDIMAPVVSVVTILQELYNINDQHQIVPYDKFYNRQLVGKINLKNDYNQWKTSKNVFSFCNFPFLLDVNLKSMVLRLDAESQMRQYAEATYIQSMQTGYFSSPYLVLRIRREHILEDSLNQLMAVAREDNKSFKKPLKVVFEGEEGVDEGGVKKEFFQLIVKQIFDLKYGMFIMDEASHLYWFNSVSFESIEQYTLIGIVLGLAIYNSVMVNVLFPTVVYKKLLGGMPDLRDLKELHPMLGRSLQQLLDYDGDVEDLGVTFVVTKDKFGEVVSHELKPGGAHIPVTAKNRQEYVDLYIRYELNELVKDQFAAFSHGWHMLLSEQVLQLFRPEELSLMVCGSSEELDFNVLKKSTVYSPDGGGEGAPPYSATHPAIINFWDVVLSFNQEQKKKFLAFTTGSDRVPLGGLSSIHLIIQRNGPDSDRLPTASTCYNVLLLPEYASKEKMRERLITAINNYEGFGLA